MNDEEVHTLSDLALSILELPALPVNPAPPSSTLDFLLSERDVLGSTDSVREDPSLGGFDERGGVEVFLLWQGRDEVSSVGRVGRNVELIEEEEEKRSQSSLSGIKEIGAREGEKVGVVFARDRKRKGWKVGRKSGKTRDSR